MNTARQLINECEEQGGHIVLIGSDRLRIERGESLPADLIERIRANKPQLIEVLSRVETPDQDDIEERAALVEYGAGVPREWAEGFALLHPDRPPAGVPCDRWQRFVDVAGKFLDRGYAAQAAALGWGPLELFGCDATKPAVCVDLQGLLWLIPEGARLVTLTADAATLRMSTGAIQTYHRVVPRGAVLAWELAPEAST